MNEKIKELAEQANIPKYNLEYGTELCIAPHLEKFAELIIKECLGMVGNQTTLDTNEDFREGFRLGRFLAWSDIRKHFGLREE